MLWVLVLGNTKDMEVKTPLKGVYAVPVAAVSRQSLDCSSRALPRGRVTLPGRGQALPGQPAGVSAHSRRGRGQPLAPVFSIYN